MGKVERIKELTKLLNEARDNYYNNSTSKISDKEYDNLFDELQSLEKETGTVLSNSPTQTVGYEVSSKLEKVVHNHPMLSLDKTKSVDELKRFIGDRVCLLMHKLDGLTISLEYNNGVLIKAETRGNGEQGELITNNARVFKNIPLQIEYTGHLIVDGEAIIAYDDFDKINEKLSDEEKYKNPRNLCSGSCRQLDSEIAAKRNIKFIAWKVVEGFDNTNSFQEKLDLASSLGFDIVSYYLLYDANIEEKIEYLKNEAKELKYPIDGLVVGYDDISYGKSLGMTSHHLLSQFAYKFYDELSETTLLDIKWSPSRTGLLNPVAIFEPVEIDGTTVERASLSNISIMEELELGIGDTIEVSKRNQIIPKVETNLTRSNTFAIPSTCPACGGVTEVVKDNDSKVLYCTNPNCKSKLVGRLSHFCDKNSMNIDGVSEATIEKFVELGWLTCLSDIYKLSEYKSEITKLEGFGIKSYNNMIVAIEKSKDVQLSNFIRSLGIPNIGRSQSKELAKIFKDDWDCFEDAILSGYNFTQIDGFGEVLNRNIHNWYKSWVESLYDNCLPELMRFIKPTVKSKSSSKSLDGKAFCITGKLVKYSNRDALVKDIESNQGKVVSGVTSKTDYLITNDKTSGSSKNVSAAKLGIPIITEAEFIQMFL